MRCRCTTTAWALAACPERAPAHSGLGIVDHERAWRIGHRRHIQIMRSAGRRHPVVVAGAGMRSDIMIVADDHSVVVGGTALKDHTHERLKSSALASNGREAVRLSAGKAPTIVVMAWQCPN